jgi:hypothetical protein
LAEIVNRDFLSDPENHWDKEAHEKASRQRVDLRRLEGARNAEETERRRIKGSLILMVVSCRSLTFRPGSDMMTTTRQGAFIYHAQLEKGNF